MFRHAIAFALSACAGLSPTVAPAQSPQCGDRASVVRTLADRYGETPRMIGLTAQGHVIETFASEESGSWTVTVTFADGRTCLIASGVSFESIGPSAAPAGTPA